jgi:hypothetical protein
MKKMKCNEENRKYHGNNGGENGVIMKIVMSGMAKKYHGGISNGNNHQ